MQVCVLCDGYGWFHAYDREDKIYDAVFRCPCGRGPKSNNNWPIWDSNKWADKYELMTRLEWLESWKK